MKCLSVHSDFAYKILVGEKTEEYRSWKTPHRGDLLICASSDGGFLAGNALCVVSLDEITGEKSSYVWHLSDVRPIYPQKVKGALYIFDRDISLKYIPDDISDEELNKIYG